MHKKILLPALFMCVIGQFVLTPAIYAQKSIFETAKKAVTGKSESMSDSTKIILLKYDCHLIFHKQLNSNGRRNFKLFTDCHVSWDTL